VKAVLLGLLLFASSTHAKVFQFIYIEASEGNSSGGHVAVQLGDDVYHYQYQNALIRLFKHNADAFRVNYQLLQNRSLHIADIEVSDTAYDSISNHFNVRFFEQRQKLKQLQALQHDQALLRALLQWKAGKPVTSLSAPETSLLLQGAGLFYSDSTSGKIKKSPSECDTTNSSAKINAKVRQQLENSYGKSFLPQKITYLSQELNRLSPTDNNASYSFSEHYTDTLNGLLALQTLQKAQSLTSNACFQVNLPGIRLNDAEIKQAQVFQQDLLQSVQSLMVSKRPDWGYAMFVTLARLIVIEQSKQTRQWTFLDDTNEKAIPIPGEQLALYAEQLLKQRLGDLQRLHKAASDLPETPRYYERRYINLEIMANRYQQWLISDKTGELRYQSEQKLPKAPLPLTHLLLTGLSVAQLESALQQQEIASDRLSKEDSDRNAYHLLTKNCVTALFELINEAVSGQSKQILGGFIDPKLNFIPFQAFDSVQKTYNVVKVREVPAYRQQELTKMYDREADSWVYARESNVFSSSLYKHNPDDAWFVFFTDDAVLLRPLFGAINTLAATSQSVFGLLSWPFDDGKEIKIGARGVLTSLPELAFFNIRKGSYPYPIKP
jgi:hypothetical protein